MVEVPIIPAQKSARIVAPDNVYVELPALKHLMVPVHLESDHALEVASLQLVFDELSKQIAADDIRLEMHKQQLNGNKKF